MLKIDRRAGPLIACGLGFVMLVCVVGISCRRSEPTSNVIVPPTVTSLQLVGVHSLSITEPSGLASSPSQRTLYMISDNSPAIYTIDTLGQVLSSIPVNAQDIEGVALSSNADTLYVVEETPSLVSKFLPDGTKLSSFSVTVRTLPNNSLEGITIDNLGHIVVINEKSPMMMLQFSGETEISRTTLAYTTDVSDICYDGTGDCFWIVSDESKSVIRISKAGALLGKWFIDVVQGEGIAIIGNRIYIVSDTEAKLYVFVKPS